MPRSDAEQLEKLKEARDRLTDAIAAGDDYIEYEIQGRSKRVEATTEQLERIEDLIDHYETAVQRKDGGRITVADNRGGL